ncbi:thioesterase [Brevibacillus laterosporus]|nr:thioesterase domain-containing protein [Brevibacillus laterosporus]TPG89133.1 thioesterase [Brevibacillus laterosporus]
MKLFCIPFAGGSAVMYDRWQKLIQCEIGFDQNQLEIVPLELPGRGKKMRIPPLDDLDSCVEHLYESIKGYLQEPYAIFGHSMGSLLAFELCRYLRKMGDQSPVHVFFSGRKAPQHANQDKIYNDLPEQEFLQEVYKYGGTTKQAFENKELLQLFLPILRADFKMIETYDYLDKREKLDCDISVLSGDCDYGTSMDNLKSWQEITRGTCKFRTFSGSHFFINEVTEDVVGYIYASLKEPLKM